MSSKARLAAQRIGPLRIFNEHQVLQGLLLAQNPTLPPDAAAQVKRLGEIEKLKHRRHSKPLTAPKEVAVESTNADPKLVELVTQPSLVARDIQQWLETQNKNHDDELLNLISHASANSLRALMQILALHWESGILGSRPLITQARLQAHGLLVRALQVHPATLYIKSDRGNISEQIGIPDIDKFAKFVRSLFVYMDVDLPEPGQPLDNVQDAYMRLCLQSSSFEHASKLLQGHLADKHTVSGLVAEQLVAALSRRHRVYDQSGDELETWRALLMDSDRNTPATTKYLLEQATDLEQVQSVLEVASRSVYASDIYASCQEEMVRAVARTARPNLVLAHIFGLLDRFEKETGKKRPTRAALDMCLELADTNQAATARLTELLSS